VDKKIIIAVIILLLVIIAVYLYLGSSAPPENVTYPVSQINYTTNGSNVGGISI
jgi:hypothetical protein